MVGYRAEDPRILGEDPPGGCQDHGVADRSLTILIAVMPATEGPPTDRAANRRLRRIPCAWSVTTTMTAVSGSPFLNAVTASVRAAVAAFPWFARMIFVVDIRIER
jgi:hypothetical protein